MPRCNSDQPQLVLARISIASAVGNPIRDWAPYAMTKLALHGLPSDLGMLVRTTSKAPAAQRSCHPQGSPQSCTNLTGPLRIPERVLAGGGCTSFQSLAKAFEQIHETLSNSRLQLRLESR